MALVAPDVVQLKGGDEQRIVGIEPVLRHVAERDVIGRDVSRTLVVLRRHVAVQTFVYE